jgi:hypothetical protein
MGDEQILYFPATDTQVPFRIDYNRISETLTIHVGGCIRQLDESESDILIQVMKGLGE